jgi:hypothetical protein
MCSTMTPLSGVLVPTLLSSFKRLSFPMRS